MNVHENPRTLIRTVLLLFFVFFLISGCQTNPATGKRQLNLISEAQEIQIGMESDEQISAAMGIYDNPDMEEYVSALGKKLAAESERPDLPWTFRIIDDPTVNAFALPGGFIYVTRGILTYLNNESQLAGVLGHEIGHVTAQHGPNQLSKQQLSSFGLGVAMIFSPALREIAPLANLGLQLMFMKFGRDDEYEADELGVRYMARIEEDPYQLAGVMQMLDRVSRSQSGGRLPEWLSTHPDPGNREARISEAVEGLGIDEKALLGSGDNAAYLQMLDGMIFGPDPKEGYTRNGIFYHPGLRFRVDFPNDWRVINQKQAVIAIDSQQAAAIQLSIGQSASAAEAMRSFSGMEGIEVIDARSTRINGLVSSTAEFRARTAEGIIAGRATFIEYEDRLYQLVGYSGDRNWSVFSDPIRRSTFSFMELVEPRYLNVQPLLLEIVRVNREMTLRQFNETHPSPALSLEELALINQVEPDTILSEGMYVKRVTGQKFSDEE